MNDEGREPGLRDATVARRKVHPARDETAPPGGERIMRSTLMPDALLVSTVSAAVMDGDVAECSAEAAGVTLHNIAESQPKRPKR